MNLTHSTRSQESKVVAGIFEGVASKAAATDMTPAQMIPESSRLMKERLGSSYDKWKPVRDQLGESMRKLSLSPSDKAGHVKAWNLVSKGLREVK